MTTRERTTRAKAEKQSPVDPDVKAALEDAAASKARYEEAIQQLNQMAAALKAAGISVETPPAAITTIVETPVTKDDYVGIDDPEFDPRRLTKEQLDALKPGVERPWTKSDLDKDPNKFNFVPQFIPGAIHPVLDENRRPKIWLRANGLGCCLTVGVLNENISGIFYHSYKNMEKMWLESEEYKNKGPIDAIWATGSPTKGNTWYYEPEAPTAWIDLDGKYYTPGAPMPGQESGE